MRPNDLDEIKLSILIVNFNTRELLRECLDSIYSSHTSFQLETIVVDRFSHDGSRKMAEEMFPQAKIFSFDSEENYSTALNRFLPFCKGDFILISHADIVYTPGSLDEMVAFLDRHSDVGIVGANQIYPDQRFVPSNIRNPTTSNIFLRFCIDYIKRVFPTIEINSEKIDLWNHRENVFTDTVWAAFTLRKRVLDEIGLFDKNFRQAFLNNDICKRAKMCGWEIMYLSSAKVIHYEIKTPKRIYQQKGLEYKRYGSFASEVVENDFFYFILKYYRKKDFIIFKLIKTIDYVFRILLLNMLKAIQKRDDGYTELKIRKTLQTLKSILALKYRKYPPNTSL